MHSDDPLFDPAMRAFPPVFVLRVPEGPAARWVASSINYAVAAISRRIGYESEEAFSRAFRRSEGTSPGAWRSAQQPTQ